MGPSHNLCENPGFVSQIQLSILVFPLLIKILGPPLALTFIILCFGWLLYSLYWKIPLPTRVVWRKMPEDSAIYVTGLTQLRVVELDSLSFEIMLFIIFSTKYLYGLEVGMIGGKLMLNGCLFNGKFVFEIKSHFIISYIPYGTHSLNDQLCAILSNEPLDYDHILLSYIHSQTRTSLNILKLEGPRNIGLRSS